MLKQLAIKSLKNSIGGAGTILNGAVALIKLIPLDIRDAVIDEYEKDHVDDPMIMALMKIVRTATNTPDEDINQAEPV